MVEKFIKVVVKDTEGKEFTAATTTPVQADASSDVSIVDEMGLQSDGTGIIGDTLRISYGVTFGTPSSITWYKDGAVIATNGGGNSELNKDGALFLAVKASRGTGTYKATVVADGKTYETNEIVITNKEEKATITAFTLENDYTDGKAIVYDPTDTMVVATITLNKNYDGQFAIYEAKDSKYGTKIDDLNTETNPSGKAVSDYVKADGTIKTGGTNGDSIITTDAATNFNAASFTPGAGFGHINADGTVTYKFAVNNGLTRGTEYVVLFDQASVLEDKAGQGKENVFGTKVAAPYVTTPEKVTVTKVSANNKPEVTFQNAEGNTLTWFGEAGNTLGASGIAKGDVYYATEKTNDTKKAKALGSSLTAADSKVEKGVWTSNKTAGTDAFWFATFETKKGIFAKDATTLTSEAVQIAKDGADMINLQQKGTDTVDNAKTALVTFKNLRCAGKVYIVEGKAGDSTAAALYEYYTSNTTSQIVASADVEAGASSVDVPNAINEYSGDGKDCYIAVFIPTDSANYGSLYTKDGVKNTWKLDVDETTAETKTKTENDSQGLTVVQKATTLDWDKDTKGFAAIDVSSGANAVITLTGKTFLAKDQFGQAMVSPEKVSDPAEMTKIDTIITTGERGNFTYETKDNTIDGLSAQRLEVVLTIADKKVDVKDGFKFTLLGKEVEVKHTCGTSATLTAYTPTTAGVSDQLTVKIGGDTFCDSSAAEAAAKKATAITAADAAIATAKTKAGNAGDTNSAAKYAALKKAIEDADTAVTAAKNAGATTGDANTYDVDTTDLTSAKAELKAIDDAITAAKAVAKAQTMAANASIANIGAAETGLVGLIDTAREDTTPKATYTTDNLVEGITATAAIEANATTGTFSVTFIDGTTVEGYTLATSGTGKYSAAIEKDATTIA